MKYLLITQSIQNLVTWEYYKASKAELQGKEFNYVESWEFLASGWTGNKVVVVYNLSNNKVESAQGDEGIDLLVKEALKQYKKKEAVTAVKKKEEIEKEDIDRLLTNLAPSPHHKQVKYTQTDFGYQTCSSWCCHQFFVSYPPHRKNTKLPVQAHLCNSTGAITSCESIRCHRGRYFCPLHLEPVECILGTTKNYCLDCLFSFYFHALIELVQGKHITSYNGIFPKYFDKDEVPAKINSLKERIFCGIGFEDTLNKTVYRTSVTDYESQYVRVL